MIVGQIKRHFLRKLNILGNQYALSNSIVFYAAVKRKYMPPESIEILVYIFNADVSILRNFFMLACGTLKIL